MLTIDRFYSDPEECAMTCTKSEHDRNMMLVRVLVCFIFDVICLGCIFIVFAYKYTKFAFTVDSNKAEDPQMLAKLNIRLDPPQKVSWKLMKKTLSSMLHSFLLHVNRYIFYFIISSVLIIFYVPFTSTLYLTPHRILRDESSSSSFFSSSSSS